MSNVRDVRAKGVPVVLNGANHVLKFDLNAYAELEDIYGSVDAALDKVAEGSVKALRSLIWAGLLHEDPMLDERTVGSWIGIADLQELTTSLHSAVADSKAEANPNQNKGSNTNKSKGIHKQNNGSKNIKNS